MTCFLTLDSHHCPAQFFFTLRNRSSLDVPYRIDLPTNFFSFHVSENVLSSLLLEKDGLAEYRPVGGVFSTVKNSSPFSASSQELDCDVPGVIFFVFVLLRVH